jgi:hypothetical protein
MRHVTLGRPAEAQGSGDLRLIVAYIVPIAGHDLYGVRPGFPPAAGLDPGVLWSRRQLAVGASVPHTDGFLVANPLLVLKPTTSTGTAAGARTFIASVSEITSFRPR